MLLADAVAEDDDELAVVGNREARGLGKLLRGDRDGVGRPVVLVVPHRAAERRLLLVIGEVAAFGLQLLQQLVEDRGLDDEVAVGRASRTEVGRLGQAGVARRFLDVGGFVDDHGRVAGADAVGGRAGAVGRAHHRLAAGRDDEIGARHQGLRHRNVDLGQALQNVRRRALALERLAHQPHRLERGLLAARMRREHHHVARLDAVDRVAGRGKIGIGGRHDAGDDSNRLGVFDDAFLGQFLNDADALLAQRVAQDAADLHALAHAADLVAEAGLGNAHVDEPGERDLVGDGPGDGLAQAIDTRLIVGLDDRRGLAGAGENFVELLLLLFSDALFHFRHEIVSSASLPELASVSGAGNSLWPPGD